jgi:hypothetical protein
MNNPVMQELLAGMDNNISIRIGRYLYFKSVVIVSAPINSIMSFLDGTTGWPNQITINLTFRPTFALAAEDLSEVFLAPAGATAAGSSSGGGGLLDMAKQAAGGVISNVAKSVIGSVVRKIL